jgi:hypothetical protein
LLLKLIIFHFLIIDYDLTTFIDKSDPKKVDKIRLAPKTYIPSFYYQYIKTGDLDMESKLWSISMVTIIYNLFSDDIYSRTKKIINNDKLFNLIFKNKLPPPELITFIGESIKKINHKFTKTIFEIFFNLLDEPKKIMDLIKLKEVILNI